MTALLQYLKQFTNIVLQTTNHICFFQGSNSSINFVLNALVYIKIQYQHAHFILQINGLLSNQMTHVDGMDTSFADRV